jgi:uncharacterized glyoxalase superfamily protein PhnB
VAQRRAAEGGLIVDIAKHHQLHGVQPVLPVPDLAAAIDWYCRVLGFELDFVHGEPAFYARVKLGDRSWGDPIYIHLQAGSKPIQPCGETRLHVGHDIDGLHAHAVAAGAEVLLAPTDQPWGLREITLRAPGGHVLVLGAESAAAPAHAPPRPVIACYRPKPGHEAALLVLVRSHVPTLRRLGLATDRAPIAMRAADGTLVEVFEWASAKAIEDAHAMPDVQAMWAAFGAACTYVKVSELAEAQNLFAEFTPLEG